MLRRPAGAGFMALVVALAACFSPELGDGAHMCGPGGLCPEGYSCAADDYCRRG